MMTKTGIVRANHFQRLAPSERWPTDELNLLCGYPWEPSGQYIPWRTTETPLVAFPSGPVSHIPVQSPVAESPAFGTSSRKRTRWTVTREDIGQFGPTIGCPGCEALTWDPSTTGFTHRGACADRIEQLVAASQKQADVERYEKYRRRQGMHENAPAVVSEKNAVAAALQTLNLQFLSDRFTNHL